MPKVDNVLEAQHPAEKWLPCTTYLRHAKHYLYPGLNLVSEDLVSELSNEIAVNFYKQPLLNIGFPIPCLSSQHVAKQEKTNGDPVKQLVKKKFFWKKKKKQYYFLARNLTSGIGKAQNLIEELAGEHGNSSNCRNIPYGIARLTDHLANDPDEHFKGMYNWYYGNTLTTTVINDRPYLLHAGGENLNKLCVSAFDCSKNSHDAPSVTPEISLSLPNDGFIFDIRSYDSHDLIGIRQRDRCTFLTLETNTDEFIILKRHAYVGKQEYPFVSMDVNNAQLCVTADASRRIQFWDPEHTTSCMESFQLPESDTKLPDKFLQIRFAARDTFIVIDRNRAYLFDNRVDKRKPSSIWNPANQIEMCENLSLLVPSESKHNWYIGSTHSCLLFDTRIGFTAKWTHMLKQPPSVGHAFRINKESHDLAEALLLSTQCTNEVVAIYNRWSGGKLDNIYYPVALPNRNDTLHQSRTVGLLTNPILQKKFEYSLIGLTAYKMKKRNRIFSLCSTGDLFYQCSEPNKNCSVVSSRIHDEQIQYLKDWENEFCTNFTFENLPLTATQMMDMSELVASIDESIEIPSDDTNQTCGQASWKIRRKELQSYKDLLAPCLIHDFGIDDIEQWMSDDDDNNTTIGAAEKVKNWLLESDDHNVLYSQEMFPDNCYNEETDDKYNATASEIRIRVPPAFDCQHVSSNLRRSRKFR